MHRTTRTPAASPTLPEGAFAFLTTLSARLAGRRTAPDDVRDAVGLLTATADAERAASLRPGAGEPAALVERLAVWALHRVDADTVALAHSLLGEASTEVRASAGRACGV